MRFRTLVLAALVFARPLHAQLTEAQPGARVRLKAPGILAGRYEGTVLTRSGDTLRVGGPNSQPVTVPIDRLTSFEVSRGNSRWLGAQRGIAWGSTVGLILGLVTIPAVQSCDGCRTSWSRAEESSWVLYMTASTALWGAAIGGLIGRERWEPFELQRTSVAWDSRTATVRVGFRY
jgi:hypothetical protein